MEYRLALGDDLPQLGQLRWDFWIEDGDDPGQQDQATFIEQFGTWLGPRLGADWFVWCAVEQGVIVSHMYVQRVAKLPKPSALIDAFGYVTNVYTRPHFRGRGVGATLLGKLEAWALESNFEFLVLWPSEDSVPFWHRADFTCNESLQKGVRPYLN